MLSESRICNISGKAKGIMLKLWRILGSGDGKGLDSTSLQSRQKYNFRTARSYVTYNSYHVVKMAYLQ